MCFLQYIYLGKGPIIPHIDDEKYLKSIYLLYRKYPC